MSDDKFILYFQIFPHLAAFFFIKDIFGGIDGVGNHLHLALFHPFFPKNRFSRLPRAGKAVVCLVFQRPAKPFCGDSLQSARHSGTSGVGNGDGHARFLCYGEINGCGAGHMTVHRPELVMLREKTPQRPFVGKQIIQFKLGDTVDSSPQLFNLFIKILFRRGMYQKIKLNLVPVKIPVQIHNTALRTAQVQTTKHMQDSDWFTHISSS